MPDAGAYDSPDAVAYLPDAGAYLPVAGAYLPVAGAYDSPDAGAYLPVATVLSEQKSESNESRRRVKVRRDSPITSHIGTTEARKPSLKRKSDSVFDSFKKQKEDPKIQEFKKTYNSRYLEGLSDNEILKLKNELGNPKLDQYNPTLVRLIENFESKRLVLRRYIEGPFYYANYQLEFEGNKKSFCIFGEKHIDTTGSCDEDRKSPFYTFTDFIENISKYSPSFSDIYIEEKMSRRRKVGEKKVSLDSEFYDKNDFPLEMEVILQEMDIFSISFEDAQQRLKERLKGRLKLDLTVPTDSSTLTEFRAKFKNCMQPSKKTRRTYKPSIDSEDNMRVSLRIGYQPIEECQLMRIHNVDVRQSYDFNLEIPMFYVINRILEKYNNNPKIVLKVLRMVGGSYQFLIDLISSQLSYRDTPIQTYIENFYNQIIKNDWIKHELDKVGNIRIKERIVQFIKNKIQNLIDKSPSPIQDIAYLINVFDNPILSVIKVENLSRIKELFFDIFTLHMDMYTLCRIFKIHETKVLFQPQESTNIIFYGGATHAKNISEFLEYIDARLLIKHENPNQDIGYVDLRQGL